MGDQGFNIYAYRGGNNMVENLFLLVVDNRLVTEDFNIRKGSDVLLMPTIYKQSSVHIDGMAENKILEYDTVELHIGDEIIDGVNGFVPIGSPFTDENQEFMAHLVLTLGDLEYVTQNFIIRVV